MSDLQNNKKVKELQNEKLSFSQNLIFALQHLLIMVAGAITVPLIIGSAGGLDHSQMAYLVSCALLAGGIATSIESFGLTKFLGVRLPIVSATSFAAVATLTAIISEYKYTDPVLGLQVIASGVIGAGIFCFLFAGVWSKMLRFFPKVVTGTVITVIGLALFPIGIKWITGGVKLADGAKIVDIIKPEYSEYAHNVVLMGIPDTKTLIIAGLVLLVTLVLFKLLKGIWSSLAILFGLGFGVILACMMGVTDFSQVSNASLVGYVVPFHFGFPVFEIGAIISITVIMLVLMTEATGNFMAVSNIIGKDISDKELARGLRSSGFSTIISGCIYSYPVTPFGQNVGLVGLSGIKSRFVTATTGIMLIILAFFPKMAVMITAIPQSVLGGVSFAMFGVVAVGGIRTLGKVDYEGNKNNIIVAVSIGLSLIPTVAPLFFHSLSKGAQNFLHSGITIGCISAIVLNIFFNELKFFNKNSKERGNS